MPPIVCNMKRVLVFYGCMQRKKQDRPLVNGEKWAYTMPTFTQRPAPPTAAFVVARAKVWFP
jgi:hypothetical protein